MNTQYKEFAFNCILNLLHRNTKQNFLKYKIQWKSPVIKEGIKEGGKWVKEMHSLNYFQTCLTWITTLCTVGRTVQMPD